MDLLRLGIIEFFGIFSPGVLLLMGILMLLDGYTYQQGTQGSLVSGILKESNGLLAGGMLFFVAYLFGASLRNVSVRLVQKLAWRATTILRIIALWQTKRIRHAKPSGAPEDQLTETSPYLPDVFPYPRLSEWLRKHDDARVIETLRSAFPSFDRPLSPDGTPLDDRQYDAILRDGITAVHKKCRENTTALNHIKMLVAMRSTVLFQELQRAEGMVRFLAGSVISCSVISLLAALLLVRAIWSPGRGAAFYLIIALTMGLITVVQLTRFTNVRKREVIFTWSAYKLVRDENSKGHVNDE